MDLIHLYDINNQTSRITLGVPHSGEIPTSQFYPTKQWVPCSVPVYKYTFRSDGYCLATDPPAPDIDLPTFAANASVVPGTGELVINVTVTAPTSPVWMIKFDGGLVAWSLDDAIPPPGLTGRVQMDATQRAIVMRSRNDANSFSLTFDDATGSVSFEFWASYQVHSPKLRETIQALVSDRQVWSKSNMPGPVATIYRTTIARP